jgi:hypothetical protein
MSIDISHNVLSKLSGSIVQINEGGQYPNLHMTTFDSNIEWIFVTSFSKTSNRSTSFDFSMIYALGIGGIEEIDVDSFFMITY